MKNVKASMFFELIREYLCNYLPNIRKRSLCTVKTSRDSINEFINFLQSTYSITIFEISIEQFNENEICKFGNWLIEIKHNLPSTANLRISRLQAFAKYLVQYCPVEFVSQISRVREISKFPEPKSKLPKSLTIDEMKILFSMPNQNKIFEFRDYCLMTLMYDSACRDNEIRSLKLKHITIEGNIGILRINGKGNKIRLTPITEDVVKILEKYITKFHSNRKPDNYLFFSNNKKGTKMSNDNTLRIFKKYSIRARETYPSFPHVHNHMLRHARAQNLYDANMPLPMVSKLLGHANIDTTQIYSVASVEKKKEAIEKAMFGLNSIIQKEELWYEKDEATIKHLYGL
ncbi:MAG: hypothetical protein EOL97_15400 [Spirochaetia bacterium]|nr:hypothetical protein [Spirochaetia bacterium]